MGRKARDEGYVPPEVDPSEIPKRTYFILLEPDRYGWMNWYFNKRLMQYATWSFYFVNIIFCPAHKTPDRHGLRRLQLFHEFSHCGRGELILFIMAAFASFSMIRTSITMYIHHSGTQSHIPYFNVILVAFGFYMFWSAARIMRRREFISDAIAFEKLGQPYLDYITLRRDGDAISTSTASEHRWFPSLIARVRWHPSWEERVGFIERPDHLPTVGFVDLISTAMIVAMIVMQMTQLMMLPKQTFLAIFLFGENPSYFMQPFGFAMHFIIILWLCWLMGRSIEALQTRIWVALIVAYGSGAALAQFALMYAEHLYFGPGTYNHWHFIQPWGTSATWVAACLVLYCIPLFRKAPVWAFAVYSAVAYMWGFASFIYLLTMYERGQLPRIDPYFMLMYPPMIVVLSILLAFVVIGPTELFRRLAVWLFHQTQTRLRT